MSENFTGHAHPKSLVRIISYLLFGCESQVEAWAAGAGRDCRPVDRLHHRPRPRPARPRTVDVGDWAVLVGDLKVRSA